MKTLRVPLALLLSSGAFVFAQSPAPSSPPVATTTPAPLLRSAEELEQLLAPIALYPDPLIALILPATTVPVDIVLAARHLRDAPKDRSQIEHRAWDESVKSLTHYPEVLNWLDENLQWTKQVGEAFLAQPADVMQAVQRLRAKARTAGTLVNTPQQQILAEPEVIRIVPAQRDVIYVPHYQPEVVFVDRPVYYPQPVVTFGVGVAVGSWLAYDCDWRRRTIWCGDRHRRWTGHDWRRPLLPIAPGFTHVSTHPRGVRQWCPPPAAVRPSYYTGHRTVHPIARPHPLGSPHPRPHHHRDFDADERAPQPNALPTVNPLPGSFTMVRRELPGPQAPTAAIPPAVNAPRNAYTPGGGRQFGGGDHHRGDVRQRSFDRPQGHPATLPTVPALPMAQPIQRVAPAESFGHRGHSRAAAAPAPVPSLPMVQHAAPVVVAPAPSPALQTVAPAPQPSRGDGGRRGGERVTETKHEH